ncbi:Kelch repeat type 1 [Dillenia turbinata]|uniref:Kelch repeat type 1 n=1 Tax=Dillenia turbinata TaxID=194707 RepID=A0AAN8UVF3_9MAGN
MDSVFPIPSPPTPPRPPEIPLAGYRVYASFCMREPSCCKVSNWIEYFDPTNNAWSHVSPIPGLEEDHVLKDFAMVSIGDSIFVIGGGRSTSDRARGTSSAEVYDPSADTWTVLPDMTTLRYKCVGVTWQGKIHVVGGFAEKGDWDGHVIYGPERSSADVYNPRTERWEYEAGMWRLDIPPNQIVAVGDTLFSSGDCLNPWKGYIEAYDGKLNMWNVVDGSQQRGLSSPISTSDADTDDFRPMERLYLTMAPIGCRLFFFAGYRTNSQISRSISMVHTFDINAETYAWTSFEPTEEDGEKELGTHCCAVQMSQH